VTKEQLAAVRAASKRERAHHAFNAETGTPFPVCYCEACCADREVIAMWTPALLQYIDDAMREPRREYHDLGDLD